MLSFSLLLFCAWKMSNELKIWNEILFYIQKLNKRKIFGESFRNKVAIKIHLFKKKKKKYQNYTIHGSFFQKVSQFVHVSPLSFPLWRREIAQEGKIFQ